LLEIHLKNRCRRDCVLCAVLKSYTSQTLHHGLYNPLHVLLRAIVLRRRHHRTYNPKHVPVAALQFTTSPCNQIVRLSSNSPVIIS